MIYFFVFYFFVFFPVILFYIFKKENIKKFNAFIPFVNVYYYFKICKIPFWTIFVPFVNLIVFIVSPYNLARHYRNNKFICLLSVLLPIIFLPYLAFNKKNVFYDNFFVKNQKDIDNLELQLINHSSYDSIDKNYNNNYNDIPNNNSKIDVFLDNIENNANSDDIIYDDDYIFENSTNIISNENSIISENQDDIIEIIDDDFDIIASINDIDSLEQNVINSNNEITNLENDSLIKEVEDISFSNIAIAFGGESKIENVARAKSEDLKCPRCGSSLVGAVGSCPGCGSQI